MCNHSHTYIFILVHVRLFTCTLTPWYIFLWVQWLARTCTGSDTRRQVRGLDYCYNTVPAGKRVHILLPTDRRWDQGTRSCTVCRLCKCHICAQSGVRCTGVGSKAGPTLQLEAQVLVPLSPFPTPSIECCNLLLLKAGTGEVNHTMQRKDL